MKKNNRKGFTIVELVIVIAVIAILAAVLIPTFSGMIEKAEASAITQETRAAVTVLLSEKNGTIPQGTYVIYVDGDEELWYKYDHTNGKLSTTVVEETEVASVLDDFELGEGKDELYARENTSKVFKDDADAAVEVTAQWDDLSKNVEIFING